MWHKCWTHFINKLARSMVALNHLGLLRSLNSFRIFPPLLGWEVWLRFQWPRISPALLEALCRGWRLLSFGFCQIPGVFYRRKKKKKCQKGTWYFNYFDPRSKIVDIRTVAYILNIFIPELWQLNSLWIRLVFN